MNDQTLPHAAEAALPPPDCSACLGGVAFNINRHVYVKLTDFGRAYHRKDYEDLKAAFGGKLAFDYRAPAEDSEGWSRWQLWSLMERFGRCIGMGLEAPFETTIRLELTLPNALAEGRGSDATHQHFKPINNNDLHHAAEAALPPATGSTCLGGSETDRLHAAVKEIARLTDALSAVQYWARSITSTRRSLGEIATKALAASCDYKAAPVLTVCALREEDFPALYRLQGHRVALVDLGPNPELRDAVTPNFNKETDL